MKRRLLLVGAAVVLVTPTAIAGKDGTPDIPAKEVLKTYDETIAAEKLNIAPVSAGLVPVSTRLVADNTPVLDPAGYRKSLELLQRFIVALANAGPRHDIVPEIAFKRSDRFEAYTVSQNRIEISTAAFNTLIDQIDRNSETQEQLWFLLAHEYAHVLYDHPRRYAQKEKPVGVADVAAIGLTIAAMANGYDNQAMRAQISATNNKAVLGLSGMVALSPFIEAEIYRATAAPFRKDAESLADFAAVDLLEKLGRGDSRTASAFLQNFEKYDNSLKEQLKKGFKELEGRIKTSLSQFANSAPEAMLNGDPGAALDNLKGNLLQQGIGFVFGILSKRKENIHVYYSSEKRVEGIRLYAEKFFPLTTKKASPETLAAFSRRVNVASPRELVDTFRREFAPDEAASKAMKLNLAGEYAGARAVLDAVKVKLGINADSGAESKVIKPASVGTPATAPRKAARGAVSKSKTARQVKAIAAPPLAPAAPKPPVIRSAFFHMIDAQTYEFLGRLAEAEQAYSKAVASEGVSASAYTKLATLQELSGKKTAAVNTLDLGANRFGVESMILDRISLYLGRGDIETATKLSGECQAIKDLADKCKELAKPPEKPKKSKDKTNKADKPPQSSSAA